MKLKSFKSSHGKLFTLTNTQYRSFYIPSKRGILVIHDVHSSVCACLYFCTFFSVIIYQSHLILYHKLSYNRPCFYILTVFFEYKFFATVSSATTYQSLDFICVCHILWLDLRLHLFQLHFLRFDHMHGFFRLSSSGLQL